MDRRALIVVASGVGAAVVACAGWLVLGGRNAALATVSAAELRLEGMPGGTPGGPAAGASGAPGDTLFPAVADLPSVRLDGIAKTRVRTAALLSFGGGASQWVAPGATVDGVTLAAVGSSSVSIEDLRGRSTVSLGETLPGQAATAAAPATSDDQPPPGTRSAPPPASAPGMP